MRTSIMNLRALDESTARLLEALAFVLMRVADADRKVLDAETRCMENILVDHAKISADQAMLVTEIARHRCRLADAGVAYGVSRDLRPGLDAENRRRILSFLERVALADGHLCSREHRAIRQIARELGLAAGGSSPDA